MRSREHEYLHSVDQFQWLPGAREGAAHLAAAGYRLTVVSNQRGIARGLVSYEVLHEIEERIQEELRPLGATIEAFRYCPHELDAGCDCRKPRAGLLRSLSRDLDLDLNRSWMIGDADSDVLAGRAAGCRTARVGVQTTAPHADVVAPSLLEVSKLIAERYSDAASNSAINAS